MRVVVVGAGMAGLRSADAIRKSGLDSEITVVGAEPHMPYNRPPLSKDGIGAEFDAAQLPFRVARAAAETIGWRLGAPAVAADLSARNVTLGDGTVLGWDGLVIATGVRSRRLDLPGPRAGRHAIRTLDDLTALRADLARARRIVVVGGGFIGCEVAAAARTRGLDVTVVEPEPLPMRRPLGDELAAELLRRHEGHGVRFRLGTAPAAFEGDGAGGDGRVRAVTLTDGTTLDADLVIESVGSRPNTEWLGGNGLDLTDGVACDERLRVLADGPSSSLDGGAPTPAVAGGTPAPAARADVVAAGDVARYPHPLLFGASRRIEHWTVATDTAKYAAAGLARHLSGLVSGGSPVSGGDSVHSGDLVPSGGVPGGDRTDSGGFAAVPSFWSDQYDLRIQSFGVTGLPDVRVLEGDLDGDVAVGYYHEGLLAGVVLIGLGGRYTYYRGEIAATIGALTQAGSAAR
jgi:3-phenylpropionate/trans-cinnamate dioxygenase ferredoxin reductase subunit